MTREESIARQERVKELQIPDFLQKVNVENMMEVSERSFYRSSADLSEEEEKELAQVKAVQAQIPSAQKKLEEEKHMEAMKREIANMTSEQQQEIAKCLRYGVMFRELQSTMLALAEYADATREASKKLDGVFNYD